MTEHDTVVQETRLRPGDIGRITRHAFDRARKDNVFGVAASLSYTSLLALVPLLAIVLAVLTAFPVFDAVREQIQTFIFETFVPTAGVAVEENLLRFVGATGELTVVGVLGLVFTALLLLLTIEMSFNQIFRVSRARSLLSRILVYWTILTLGPLLIGASFVIASAFVAEGLDLLGTRAADRFIQVSWLAPSLLTLVAFTLLYLVVPNRRVRLRDALTGAVLATVLFAGLRYGFIFFMSETRLYQTVYGALAALPTALLWMYLSWFVVLMGAVVTAALPEWRLHRGVLSGDAASLRLVLALDMLGLLSDAAADGRGLTRAALLQRTAASEELLAGVLERLHEGGFIARATGGRWVLVRPLRRTTLYQLLRTLHVGVPENPPPMPGRRWSGPLRVALGRARDAEAEALSISLEDLLAARRAAPKRALRSAASR